MSILALLRASRRPLSQQLLLRQVANIRLSMVSENKSLGLRQFSVFNEFSKHLKGEAKSNEEFQKSMKKLNKKFENVKEDLKVRTKKTTETIYKNVDDAWTEAEAASKKVSANVKEKFSAAKEEVSANVKEKLSAAKEEVKETFGLGKDETSGCSSASANAKDGTNVMPDAESQQTCNSQNFKGSYGGTETFVNKFKSTLSSAPKVSQAFQKLEAKVSGLAKKGYDIVKDELSSTPSKRQRMQYASNSTSSEARSTRTDVIVLPSKQSRLGEKWEAFKKKMQGHPIFKQVSGFSKPVVTMGQEIAEDMRERWETSDNRLVHKIHDLNETVFGENATALSFKEIRRRDPSFSLSDFVVEVQEMIKPVLTAYLKGDVETLKKYCSNEVIERCKAERTAYQSQGIFFDNKILHISEADVRETKMMGSTPIIIVGFQTQQIYCVRDREGLVTDGGKDTIHTVYYAWAMQQLDAEELGEGVYFPVWRLREMQQLGIQALI